MINVRYKIPTLKLCDEIAIFTMNPIKTCINSYSIHKQVN
jgi:hypothetical protein